MSKRTRAALSIAGSFVIYLIPLIGSHAVWLWGESLWAEAMRHPGGQTPAWISVDFALALTIQVAVAFLLYWFFGRPRWQRALVLLVAAPVVLVTVYTLYMFTIPKHFLIERDTAAETNQLIPGCVLSAASLVPNYSSHSLGEAGRALVVQPSSAPAHYALMDSNCSTTPLHVPYGYETTLLNVLPSGGTIYVTHDYKQKTRSWWRQQRPGTSPQSLSEPPNYSESDGMPVVSPNGSVIAWVRPISNSKDPPVRRVAIEHLEGGEAQYIGLEDFWPAGLTLFAVSNDGEVTASTLQGDVLLLDAKGRKETLFQGADYGISVQFTTFKRVGSGWLAWDAYKENGPYAIAWQLAGGSGKYRLPRGRSITSAAADGAGQYVALSATTSYSIGAIKDLLLVLRARDGAEIFRRYLPTYSRSQVVFLAPHWFAYDHWGNVKLLKLPQ